MSAAALTTRPAESPDTGSREAQARRAVPGKWPAAALYAVLTMVLMYPLSVHPASLLAGDGPDTQLGLFVLSWDVHAFTQQPFGLFNTNAFHPLPRTLAFQDNLLGSALLAAPILWLTGNPVLGLNIVVLLSTMLCGLGGYVLARRAGMGAEAALLAGIIFAFCPARFFRYSQFGLGPVQWIPLCLASLHAYLDGGRTRDLRIAVGFFTLQTLTSSHGAVFAVVAVVLLLLYRFGLGEPLRIGRRVRDLGITGAALFVPAVLCYLPYRLNQTAVGLRRTLEGWSTNYESFLASPTHVHAALLSALGWAHVNEVAAGFLFPGYVPLLLTAAGLGLAAAATVGRGATAAGRFGALTYPAIEIATALLAMGLAGGLVRALLRAPAATDPATAWLTLAPWAVGAGVA